MEFDIEKDETFLYLDKERRELAEWLSKLDKQRGKLYDSINLLYYCRNLFYDRRNLLLKEPVEYKRIEEIKALSFESGSSISKRSFESVGKTGCIYPSKQSSQSSHSSRSSKTQEEFRKSVLARDKVCIISESVEAANCEACHIVALKDKEHFDDYCKLFEISFHPFIDSDSTKRLNSVCNGILFSPSMHRLYDSHYFTILYSDEKYEFWCQNQDLLDKVMKENPGVKLLTEKNGKEVNFGDDDTKKPYKNFLKFHNLQFINKASGLKGNADPTEFKRNDSEKTLKLYSDKEDFCDDMENVSFYDEKSSEEAIKRWEEVKFTETFLQLK
ncbi:hypothetical protein HDU92_002813 [Lobulomyces angularis]|nr:hypothetical protein HDU92_002813 [Lobulomyces angularis]